MNANFKSSDTYTVYASSILSGQDRKIMSILYLPLIGVNATTLYFVLWSDLQGDSVMSKLSRPFLRLTTSLDISINALNKACDKLEAFGLLQKYQKDNEFILVLKSPKSANAFFNNDIFRSLLQEKIGEEEFCRSKAYFAYKPTIPNGFVNVSKSFQEVNEFPLNLREKDNDELVERQEGKLDLNYNFEQLYSGLTNISKYAFTDNIKEAIGNIMYLYNISLVDMRSIITKSYNFKEMSIDMDKLRFIASSSYQSPIEKKKNEVKLSGNESIDDFIKKCETLTPFEFLKERDGITPIGPDLELIIELRKTSLPDSVINVIIDYVLKKNDNIFSRPYSLKLASSLQRNKINNAYDAMIKLKYPSTKVNKVNKDEVIEDDEIEKMLEKLDRGEF